MSLLVRIFRPLFWPMVFLGMGILLVQSC